MYTARKFFIFLSAAQLLQEAECLVEPKGDCIMLMHHSCQLHFSVTNNLQSDLFLCTEAAISLSNLKLAAIVFVAFVCVCTWKNATALLCFENKHLMYFVLTMQICKRSIFLRE